MPKHTNKRRLYNIRAILNELTSPDDDQHAAFGACYKPQLVWALVRIRREIDA